MSVQVRKKSIFFVPCILGKYKTGNILYDENPNEEKQDL